LLVFYLCHFFCFTHVSVLPKMLRWFGFAFYMHSFVMMRVAFSERDAWREQAESRDGGLYVRHLDGSEACRDKGNQDAQ